MPARFSGKFDLYSTQLPFLISEYLPKGATSPQFEAVHKKILFFQGKSDFSMRIALREPKNGGSTDAATAGMFSCSQVVNPFSDEELEPIHIMRGAAGNVTFSKKDAAHTSTAGTGPGYTARLELDTEGGDTCGAGMISSGAGTIKMRKVWQGSANGDGLAPELFEGYWTFNVRYGPTLRRKGWGSSQSYSAGFWAVRARTDAAGEEIGIDAGTGLYFSMAAFSSRAHHGHNHDDFDDY